jgi:hypothetical protein
VINDTDKLASRMGCNVSINEDKAMVRERDCNDYEKNAPIVSEAEKMIIQNNWQTLKLHIANIGVITYVRLVYCCIS